MDRKALFITALLLAICGVYSEAKPPSSSPPLTMPYLQNVKTDGITIMWEMSKTASCQIDYGLDTGYGSTAYPTNMTSSGNTIIYKAVISGLDAGTTYHYRLTAGEWIGQDNIFTTAPQGDVDFSFGVWADSQGGSFEPTNSLIADMGANVDIAIACGDMAENGGDYQSVDQYFLDRIPSNLGAAAVPYFIAWGNHDNMGGAIIKDFYDPGGGNYSFDYAGCHFVCIDDAYLNAFSWIESDLQQAVTAGARHIFVFVHRPPYCELWIDGNAALRYYLVPMLQEYGVDILFSGHTHEYERGYLDNVYYCIASGASWLDYPEILVYDWPHMTVGGYHDLGPGVDGGLVHEYTRVDVTSTGWLATMIPFYEDGSRRTDVTDTFSGGQPNPKAWMPNPGNGRSDVDVNITLSWTAGADAVSHDVYFGTNPDPGTGEFQGNQTETVFDPGTLSENTPYYWRIDEFTGTETITGDLWTFTTGQSPQLIGHWTFDNTLEDSAGSADGVFSDGSPTYVTGQFGSAISLDGINDHVVLGDSSDLNFGIGTDFTVALWVNTIGWDNDAAIISNKNWAYGGNVGWVIAGQSGGGGWWQWNYCASGADRLDYDPAGPIMNDGLWHHLCVTHDRDGAARFYFDGDYQSQMSLASSMGLIDAGYPTVIGTDGAEGAEWSFWFAGDIDEVRIYNYVLTDNDVADLAGGTSAEDIYVNDIAMSWRMGSGSKYYGQATVWIKDEGGDNVADAVVYGDWSGDVYGPDNGVTGPDGTVLIESDSLKNGGTFTFTVTDVVKDGFVYNPSLNVETSDSITAP